MSDGSEPGASSWQPKRYGITVSHSAKDFTLVDQGIRIMDSIGIEVLKQFPHIPEPDLARACRRNTSVFVSRSIPQSFQVFGIAFPWYFTTVKLICHYIF